MSKLSFDELVNLRVLLAIEGIGPAKIRSLLSRFKTTEKILSADYNSLILVEGISTQLGKRIQQAHQKRSEIESHLKKEYDKLDKIGGYIITVWDKEFPSLLKKIYDPPLLIYCAGNFTEPDQYSIAVVGTRNPTNYGRLQAERITSELSNQGITITSGLARGIDSIAHASALKTGGRTIAVIGSGLDVIYPPENKRLFNEIISNGVVISEFPLGTSPDAQNFPRRNRIISGLSLGVLVIETSVNGGAMQTAALALDQNRDVFAVPGNLGVGQAEGTNLLIQRGEAKLVSNADDIVYELELKLKPVIGKNIPIPAVELNLFEEKIMASLTGNPRQIDQIAEITNLSTSDCLVHLLSLEFKGMVKQLPGKMFSSL